MIADLDIILEDFDKVNPSDRAKEIRVELLKEVDRIIDDANSIKEVTPKLLKKELKRKRFKNLYDQLIKARKVNDTSSLTSIINELFIFEHTQPRLEVLKDNTYSKVVQKKREILSELRNTGVFVLERGTIEDYYPKEITSSNKISMAQEFCKIVNDIKKINSLSDVLEIEGDSHSELELIFKRIFDF